MTLGLTVACGGGTATPAAPTAAPAAVQPASTFGTLSAGTSRCFQFAGDPACFSGARVRAQGLTSAVGAPSAPSGLTASASGSTVTLTWLAPTGTDPATSYIIEAGSAPGLANLANFSTGTSATTFTAGGVPAGSYYVRVRASNGSGASAPSNEVLLVVGSSGPAPCSAPNAPSGLTSTVSGSTVTLSWTAPSGGCAATSYILQAGTASGLSNLANANIGTTATSYVAIGVGNGVYYVRVVAANAFGQSAASNEVVATVSVVSGPVVVTGTWTGTVIGGTGGHSSAMTLVLSQNGTQVIGSFGLVDNQGQLASTSVSGTVTGSVFSFTGAHYFDRGGCGVAFNGSAQVSATTMQGGLTVVQDISQQCGTLTGPNQFPVPFTLTRQ